MHEPSRPALRLIPGGHTDGDGRHPVNLLRHDTDQVRSVTWNLSQLLAAIRRHSPRRTGDSEWTFSIGRGRRAPSLTIATNGPGKFWAERVIKDADGRPRKLDDDHELSLGEVQFFVTEFYAGRPGSQPSDEILIVLEDSDDQRVDGR
jgi:hypothetical protein